MPALFASIFVAFIAMLAYVGGKEEESRAALGKACIEAGGEWRGRTCTRPPQPTGAKTCQKSPLP